MPEAPSSPPRRSGAFLVAAGIFLSRIAGLVRERVLAHYLGTSAAADAFKAALRIPNLLQNLFGEGVLSASFIPVYARLLGEGKEAEATRVASIVASLLALVTTSLVALGMLFTPLLIDLIAPGFEGERRDATLQLVRILFPGTGLLVMSAWCLGILHSHRRFFLSYAAPVLWNAAIIAACAWGARTVDGYQLAVWVSGGAVAGSALQFLVQVPAVLRLAPGLRPAFSLQEPPVRNVFHNLGPVVLGRGVVQISAYIDAILASFLPGGAVAALSYAQVLYTLPVSLFGMSVSASELPEMARHAGVDEESAGKLRARLTAGLSRIAFFVVPSAVAFLALGDVIAATLFQTGAFGRDQAVWVWGVLAGSSVGLLAGTQGRLYSSAFYALSDTRTPLRFAIIRVALVTSLGWALSMPLPRLLNWDLRWGAAGITLAGAIASWLEFSLLRGALRKRLGPTALPRRHTLLLWGCAVSSSLLPFFLARGLAESLPAALKGLLVLSLYGATYLGLTALARVSESQTLFHRVTRRLKRRS